MKYYKGFLIVLVVLVLAGCSSEQTSTISTTEGSPNDPNVGDDTYVPDFQSGELLFENTWIPDAMETGTREEIKFDLTNLSDQILSGVNIMVELKGLTTGSLAEVDPTSPGYAPEVYLLLFEIPEIDAGEQINLTQSFTVPATIREGIYAGIFAVDYQQGADVISSRAISGSTLVGKPDRSNLRILDYSLGGSNGYSFELPRKVAPLKGVDLGEPTWVVNLDVESMGEHTFDPVDLQFMVNVEGLGRYPLRFARFTGEEQVGLDGQTRYVNALEERFVFEKQCKMYQGVYPVTDLTPGSDQTAPELEVCAALFRETTYQQTFYLYLPEELVTELQGLSSDTYGTLEIYLNKDGTVSEWKDLYGDNTAKIPVIYLAENLVATRSSGISTANVKTYENCMADYQSDKGVGSDDYFKIGYEISLQGSYRQGDSKMSCKNGFSDTDNLLGQNVEDPDGRITAFSAAASGNAYVGLLGSQLKPLDIELATMVDMDDLVSSNFLVRIGAFDPRILKRNKSNSSSAADQSIMNDDTKKDTQRGIITYELYKSFPTNDNMWETGEECLSIWDPSETYTPPAANKILQLSNTVRYLDDLYYAVKSNTFSPPPDHAEEWQKSVWDKAVKYELGAVVDYLGNAYIARKINKAKPPSVNKDYWSRLNDCEQAAGDARLENWQKQLASAIVSTELTNSAGQSSGYNTSSTFSEWYDAISSAALDNSTNFASFIETVGTSGYSASTLGTLVAPDNYTANPPTSCEQLTNWNQADQFGLECWSNVFNTVDSETGEERFTKYTEKEVGSTILLGFLPVDWFLGFEGSIGLQGGLAIGSKNHIRFKQPFTALLQGFGGFDIGKATERVQFRAGILIKVALLKISTELVNFDFRYRPGVDGNDGNPGQFRLEWYNPFNLEFLSGKIMAEVELGINFLIEWNKKWSKDLVQWDGFKTSFDAFQGCLGDRLYADPSNPDATTEYRLGAFPVISDEKSGGFIYDGIDDFIQTNADSAFDVGTSDFTVDLWYYHGTTMYDTETNDLVSSGGFVSGSDGWSLSLVANYLQPFYKSGGKIYKIAIEADGTTLDGGKWHHIQMERHAGIFYVYLNGSLVGHKSQAVTANLTEPDSSKKYLVVGGRAGGANDKGNSVQGYIADIRLITKSLSAGADSTRVPSVPPAASDYAETQFLLRAAKEIRTDGPFTRAYLTSKEETGKTLAQQALTTDFAPYASTNVEVHPSRWSTSNSAYSGLQTYAEQGCQGPL